MPNYENPFPAIAPHSRRFGPVIRYLGVAVFALGLLCQSAMSQELLDGIVVIVDESAITQRELDEEIELVKLNFTESNRIPPAYEVLRKQILEKLIGASLMLQEAKRRGITVTDSQLNQAMQQQAQRQDMTLSSFRQALISRGLSYENYRENVRRDMIILALQRSYSQRYASISDAEVDDHLERTAGSNKNLEYRLSHILIAVPDAADPETVDKAKIVASDLVRKLDQGAQFDQLANTYSASETALQGGDLGWRKQAEIPSIFTDMVLKMKTGESAGPVRSASGFHIVYLAETRDLETSISEQTRSRHILIRSNELITEEEARDRLVEFRQRIQAGEDFARLARLYSVDYVSGSVGGDVGWIEPGGMVREYEEITDGLEVGELSQPFRTRFGWHIVEVTERRSVDETEQNKRRKIYSQLLEQKQQEVFDLWRRRLRDEAYVVYPGA